MPMMDAVVVISVVAMVVGIPLMGLTLRFSLKPVVDAYVRLREAHLGRAGDVDLLRARVVRLEAALDAARFGHPGVDPIQPGTPVGSFAEGRVRQR